MNISGIILKSSLRKTLKINRIYNRPYKSFFIENRIRSFCKPSNERINLIEIFESGKISELEKYPPELVQSEINQFIEREFDPNETYLKSIQKVLKDLKRNSEIKEKEFNQWRQKFDESSSNFNYYDAEVAFNRMSDTGLIHDPKIYNTMLAHHIRNDDVFKVGLIFTNMKEKKILNFETFMILTMYYCKKKNIAKAIDVYNDLLKLMNADNEKKDTIEFKDTVFPYLSLIIMSANKFERLNVAKTLLRDTGFNNTDPNEFIKFLESEDLYQNMEEFEIYDDEIESNPINK